MSKPIKKYIQIGEKLQLDYLLKETTNIETNVTNYEKINNEGSESYEIYGLNTKSNIFYPKEKGIYTLELSSQQFEIHVIDIPDNVIHRWVFNEGTGFVASDSVGNADGVINGPEYITGKYFDTYALKGDGSNDYIELTNLGDFGSTNRYNSSVVLTVDDYTKNHGVAFGLQDSGLGNNEFSLFFDNQYGGTNGKPGLVIGDGSSGTNAKNFELDISVDDGEPHRIVFNIIDAKEEEVEGWVDGQKVNVDVVRDDNLNSEPPNFVGPMTIFARNDNEDGEVSPTDFFEGVLDDIMFFESPLGEDEIEFDYKRQIWVD